MFVTQKSLYTSEIVAIPSININRQIDFPAVRLQSCSWQRLLISSHESYMLICTKRTRGLGRGCARRDSLADLQNESGKTDDTGQTSARDGDGLASTGSRDGGARLGGNNTASGGGDGGVGVVVGAENDNVSLHVCANASE